MSEKHACIPTADDCRTPNVLGKEASHSWMLFLKAVLIKTQVSYKKLITKQITVYSITETC